MAAVLVCPHVKAFAISESWNIFSQHDHWRGMITYKIIHKAKMRTIMLVRYISLALLPIPTAVSWRDQNELALVSLPS